jgi:hypothetical protein
MNTDIGAIMSGVAALILAFVEVRRLKPKKEEEEKKEKPEAEPSKEKLTNLKQRWVLLLCVILTVTTICLFTIPRVIGKTLVIELTYPQDGSSISQETTVKGYATKELSSDQHLYIVVGYGELWWPQYSEITMGYSHITKRYEFSTPARIGKTDDVGKGFTIRAILVDSPIHQHFQSWFEQNVITEEWLGIPILEVNQRGKVQICAGITVTRQ